MPPKTLILTGASRGIGLAIAHYLLRAPQSNNVVVLARSKAPLEELRKQYPIQVRVLDGDLSDFSMAKKAVDLAVEEFGRIDGLILNHGVLPRNAKVATSEVEEWRDAFDINFFSCIAFANATLPELRKNRGCIVLTSSGASQKGTTGWGAYGSSKAALNHLASTLASEEPEVTSISVRPGMVDTAMQADVRDNHSSSLDEETAATFHNAHKTGQLLKPEQPGNVMARMVLDPPRDLNGRYVTWNSEELAAFQD